MNSQIDIQQNTPLNKGKKYIENGIDLSKENKYVKNNKSIFKILSSYFNRDELSRYEIVPYNENQSYLAFGTFSVVFKGTYKLSTPKNGKDKIDVVFKVGNIGITPEYKNCKSIYSRNISFCIDYFEINSDHTLNTINERLKIAVFRYFTFNLKYDYINFLSTSTERLFYKKIIQNLEKIHKANIVHRDLSLGNICFDTDNDDLKQKIKDRVPIYCNEDELNIKILDLGASLQMEGPYKEIGINQKNIGTPIYWSVGYHQNGIYYYKDELEAIIYCCWDYYTFCHSSDKIENISSLPWVNLDSLKDVFKTKKSILQLILTNDLKNIEIPCFIVRLLQYCNTLVNNEMIDYTRVYQIIEETVV